MGSLLSAIVIGPLSDSGNVNMIFWVCLPLSAQIVVSG